MYVQGIANFLDDFMGGLILISLSLLVGSLLWAYFILRIGRDPAGVDKAVAKYSVSEVRTRIAQAASFKCWLCQ